MKSGLDAPLVALAVLLVLAPGCSALRGATPEAPTLVLLQRSPWDVEIRRPLAKLGFKVVDKDDPAAAGARYGLAVSVGPRIDYCVVNEHEKVARVTYELTEVASRTVLASLHKPGWTGPCIIRWPTVFDELAEELAAAWPIAVGRAGR
jgi:hypothetical protein